MREMRIGGGEPELMWNEQDLMAYLNVSRATLYRIRHGENPPPGYRVGGRMRYRPEEIDRWVLAQPKYGGGAT